MIDTTRKLATIVALDVAGDDTRTEADEARGRQACVWKRSDAMTNERTLQMRRNRREPIPAQSTMMS